MSTVYELYYWPTIHGRGEFVRLALEEAATDYVDVARSSGDAESALVRFLEDPDIARPPFAPPFLKAGDLVIGQTANILLFLGAHHRLAPREEAGRLWTHQLQLTMADFVAEIHDTHHPISAGLYYEEQQEPARRRARDFRENRLPKFLAYFEAVLERNPRGQRHLVGTKLTYADLSMFEVLGGLRHAFPRTLESIERRFPRLIALHDRVESRPRIAAYLASERRVPFDQQGVFRHYPELDA